MWILPSRHSGVNQRLTNGVDTTFAQALVVSVGAARIGVAVDAHAGGRILLHVGRDVSYLARSRQTESADLSKSNRMLLNEDHFFTSAAAVA